MPESYRRQAEGHGADEKADQEAPVLEIAAVTASPAFPDHLLHTAGFRLIHQLPFLPLAAGWDPT